VPRQRRTTTGTPSDRRHRQALKEAGVSFRSAHTATLAEIAKEIDNDRPVCVAIDWLDHSGSHYVIIASVLNDEILILDPGAGPTVMPTRTSRPVPQLGSPLLPNENKIRGDDAGMGPVVNSAGLYLTAVNYQVRPRPTEFLRRC
jgi:ABC-type bacteriocin/lantibiotic exporter with double-glycine peptidase domain